MLKKQKRNSRRRPPKVNRSNVELVQYCEDMIREHSRHVRYFLDLLEAARQMSNAAHKSEPDFDEQNDA